MIPRYFVSTLSGDHSGKLSTGSVRERCNTAFGRPTAGTEYHDVSVGVCAVMCLCGTMCLWDVVSVRLVCAA